MAKQHRELVVREGWIFFLPLLFFALLALVLGRHPALIAVLFVLAAYVAWFFRNPYRQIPEDPDAIVSPADGKVVGIHRLEDGRNLITIFLNIFNVHVNRYPIGGSVEKVEYTKGRFLAAYKEDASQVNERNLVVIRDGDFRVDVIQIAGLIARRIVCWASESDQVLKGGRFGLIRFGSRMDIFLPESCRILVKPGQKVKGGSDILAMRK